MSYRETLDSAARRRFHDIILFLFIARIVYNGDVIQARGTAASGLQQNSFEHWVPFPLVARRLINIV